MAKSDLIQKSDAEFASQMQLFKNNIGKHAANAPTMPMNGSSLPLASGNMNSRLNPNSTAKASSP